MATHEDTTPLDMNLLNEISDGMIATLNTDNK